MNEEKITIGKAIKILRGFHQKDCYKGTPLDIAIPFIINYIRDMQQENAKLKEKISKVTKVINEDINNTKRIEKEIISYGENVNDYSLSLKELLKYEIKLLKILESGD